MKRKIRDAQFEHPELVQKRIRAKSVPDAAGCWIWQGALDSEGYGHISAEGRSWPVHRASIAAFHGPFPMNRVSDHLCRVRSCVNPEHLESVMPVTNTNRGINGTRTNIRGGCSRHGLERGEVIFYRDGRPLWSCHICLEERHVAA